MLKQFWKLVKIMSENNKILVIGDGCIDVSCYCTVSRFCPDAPVPVLDVIKKVTNPGMAGNLVENIRYLGGTVDFITNDNFAFLTKTRFIEYKTNHFYLRVDQNDKVDCIKDIESINFKDYKAVVISDYNKGFLTTKHLEFIGKSHDLTYIDTKKILGPWASNYTFIKINRAEYKLSEEQIKFYDLDNKIVQTLGEEGCKYRDKIYPVEKVPIRNLSGCGDNFLASLVVKYLETGDIDKSIVFANEQTTIAVQKRGIGLYSKI